MEDETEEFVIMSAWLRPRQSATVKRAAKQWDTSANAALRRIIDEWERVNPTGIIKIGGANGNDHETAN